MSTRLDAVYNRCRPVPPWNGSSSASRLRKATTRCWKGFRSGRREAGGGVTGSGVVIAGAILLVPALLFSQHPTPPDTVRAPATTPAPIQTPAPAQTTPSAEPKPPTHPEVVNLTLKGVHAVKQSELQQSISTTASY